MSKEDFVSFEQAKRLKACGFNEMCLFHYTDNGVLHQNAIPVKTFPNMYVVQNELELCNLCYSKDKCSAPKLAQACKWLRSKGLSVQVYLNGIRNMYYNEIWETKCNGRSTCPSKMFDTYEQAQSAGIDVALGLLERECNLESG